MGNLEEQKKFLFYTTEEGTTNIQVILDEDTVWATQSLMSEIFDVEENTITYHIGNVYSDGELSKDSTTRKIRVVRKEGTREVSRELDFYNLDMIISVGYRVNSLIATRFRIWATQILKEYEKFGVTQDREFKSDFDKMIETVKGGKLPKEKFKKIGEPLSDFNKKLKKGLDWNPKENKE